MDTKSRWSSFPSKLLEGPVWQIWGHSGSSLNVYPNIFAMHNSTLIKAQICHAFESKTDCFRSWQITTTSSNE
jgi:hypothetical protein